jgi:hypothetical protein
MHKVSAYKYIYENGKKKWEKKKKRDFLLAGPGGSAQPSASARVGAVGGPAGPRRSGAARADAVGEGPRVSERRGVNGAERATEGGGGEPVGSTAGDVRGGSPPRRPRVAGPWRGGGRSRR